MKIIHFADLHIGVENYGTIDPDTGLSSRLNDFLNVFDELVDYAITHTVDLVVLAGDVYKSRDPSQTHQREFAKRISRLTKANIPTFVVVGNHDLPNSTNRATAVEIFPTLDVAGIHVGDTLTTHIITTEAGPIQIISLPWPKKGSLLSREETKGLNIDQVRMELERRLTEGIRANAANLNPNIPAIIVGHVTVNGATVGSERSMMMGNDHTLLVSSLQYPQIDYVALGHIHKHQVVSSNHPQIVYSGSLERVDFSEEHEDKGFCVIILDETRPATTRLSSFEFVKVSARKFLTIDVQVPPDTGDPNGYIAFQISTHSVDEAIVRLRIKLPSNLYQLINERQIRDSLASAKFIANITYESLSQRRPSVSVEKAQDLNPLKALELYASNKGDLEEISEEFLKIGENIINIVNGKE
tara:strand:+ start:4233 stop:5474 length:1242 start_codon:yes stop_codon:yes gene_type:complete